MSYVDEEVVRKADVERGASFELKFGPPSGGEVVVDVDAVKDMGFIDFPDGSFQINGVLVELLDDRGRRVARGDGKLSFAVPSTPAASSGVDWTVRITNNANRKATLVTTVAFTGYRPLMKQDVPFKLLNEKLALVFTDPPPIKLVLRNKTIEWRRQQRGGRLEVRTDPPPQNDYPPWTAIRHTMVHFEANADVQRVYGNDLHDIDLGKLVLAEGTIETTDITVRATIHDGQFALKVHVKFKSNGAKYAGTLDIGLKSGVVDLYLVLEYPNGRPRFRVMPHADVGGYHWAVDDTYVRYAVRGAIEYMIEEKFPRRVGDKLAQACMAWILGDRDRRLINRRFDLELRYAGDEPGPIVATDETPLPPMQQGRLSAVRNIVVLMMENRSFDNMLGFLSLEGRTDVDGLRLDMSNPILPTALDLRPSPDRQTVFRLASTFGMVDPGHGFGAQRNQRGNWPLVDLPEPLPDPMIPPRGGFIVDYQGRCQRAGLSKEEVLRRRVEVMGFYGAAEVPTYAQLAEEFTICDRWFASHPGSTWPNRFVSTTGYLSLDALGRPEIDNPDISTFDPLDTLSIFDHLDANHVDWRYFEHDFGFARLFERFTNDRRIVNIDDPNAGFFALARAGTLPPVTYIEPSLTELPPGNDDHAPTDIRAGQLLVGNIVNALRESPQWPNTLFIITYDEHGGFFDHVPNESGKTTPLCHDPVTGDPVTHFGMRVPTLVVSPLVRRRFCSRDEFDHCSILKTIIQTFMFARPPNMGARVTNARSLESLIADAPILDRKKVDLARLPAATPVPPRTTTPEPNDFHTLMTRLYLRRRDSTPTGPTRPPGTTVRDHRG